MCLKQKTLEPLDLGIVMRHREACGVSFLINAGAARLAPATSRVELCDSLLL